jgi:hypothetical protein
MKRADVASKSNSDLAGIDGIIVLILLGLLCVQVWGLGVTHTDDAMWTLWAQTPSASPAMEGAIAQGRLWILVLGTAILKTLYWQSTVLGEVLRLGTFAVFFISFYAAIAAYWGCRAASVAAILFLALNVIRWDGSALTTYPLIVWPSATLCTWSILLGRRYFRVGEWWSLAASGLLLLPSLMVNEGAMALFIVIYGFSILGNNIEAAGTTGLVQSFFTRRSRHLLIVGAAAIIVYAVAAVLWLLLHPTRYDGHAIAQFNPDAFVATLLSFSLSGSVLHDLVVPYSVSFADAMTDTGVAIAYDPFIYMRQLRSYPGSLLVGGLATFAIGKALWRPERKFAWRGSLLLIVVGLVVACLPIAPVAMTEKYQSWHVNVGVQSYVLTILSHFGVSLVLAGAVLLVTPRGVFGILIGVLVAVAVGSLGAVANRLNEAMIADIRPETGRWRVMGFAIQTLDEVGIKTGAIYAPRFRGGSWFTVVPEDYWTKLARYKYGRHIEVSTKSNQVVLEAGYSILDYGLMQDNRRFFVSIAHVGTNRSVDKIAVFHESEDPSELAFYAVSYKAVGGELVRHRLATMPIAPGNARVRVLAGIQAEINSVTVAPIADLSPSVPLD